MLVDETQDFEVGIAHGFRDRCRLRRGSRWQIGDLDSLDNELLNLEVAKIRNWKCFRNVLEVRKAQCVFAIYDTGEDEPEQPPDDIEAVVSLESPGDRRHTVAARQIDPGTGLAGLSGIVASAHNPVRMSLAPRLVDREAVGSVINIAAINFNLARLTGPALGGWIIAVWGVSAALLVQALCYLPFILAIGFLRPRQRPTSQIKQESFLGALADGFRHVLSNPLIRHAIMITALFSIVVRGTLEILPVLADGVFDRGAAGLGLLTSSAGLGALAAGIAKIVMPVQIAGRLSSTALASALVGIALVPAVGLSTSWELTLLLIAGLGFAGTLSAVSLQTTIQADLDDDLRGRVMSLWVVVGIGGAALGAIILGNLVDLIGFPQALLSAGGLSGVILMLFLIRISRASGKSPSSA